MIIIENTTPTVSFQMAYNGAAYDLSTATEVEISLKQYGLQTPVLLTKTKTDNEVTISGDDNNIASAVFTQQETAQLHRGQAWVQCRVKASDGTVLGELATSIWVGEGLSAEVL